MKNMLVNNGWNESSKSAKKVSEDIEKAAKELKENVELVSVAPRFCGDFQKGIDYIGDLTQFEKEFILHAAIADHFVHLTGAIVATVRVAASSAASGAAAGLILEALLGEESLLGSGEHEVLAAVTALQRLVLIHGFSLPPE